MLTYYYTDLSPILFYCSSNAIYHLASQDHLNGVKAFLQKHGGGMDQVDSFRISEDELAKVHCCLFYATKYIVSSL